MTGLRRWPWVALGVGAVAFAIYWSCNVWFTEGRNDFFLLADAFLHGRTWLHPADLMGPWDRI
ncbi:MAG: hypothetical protein QOH08_498, partial [Chloroflexota bacterium]|nr:hypothetical protein [Chloroflexota bacterium]